MVGQLFLIIDTGAFTSIIGSLLARALASKAKDAGMKVEQVLFEKPMKIGGVGSGTQECRYALKTTLAVNHIGSDESHPHTWSAPIVEGDGSHLPGLLGMDSLEKNRGIVDVGGGRLIYPGPGEVQIILPPGSIEMPIVKSPSGHPCVVVDQFAKLPRQQAGGVKEAVPTLAVTPVAKPSGSARQEPYATKPSINPRILIVEEQPIASIFFAERGFTVEKRTPAEVLSTEAQQVNGKIKDSQYAALWMSLPSDGHQCVPKRNRGRFPKVMSLWFRTAVMTGILAFLVGPRGGSWLEPEIAALQTDGKGVMSMHHYCHFNETYTPESVLASDGMFFMLSSKPIQSNKCKCPPNTTHHKDYEAILGKNYKAERRLRVHTNITEKLILHTQSMWKPLAAEALFPTMSASGTGPVSGSGPRGPIGKEESSEPIQVFPTEKCSKSKRKEEG